MGSTFTNLVIWQMVASQWRVTSTPCRLYIHTFWLNVYIHSRLISTNQATKLFKFFHCIGNMEQCGTKNVCKKISLHRFYLFLLYSNETKEMKLISMVRWSKKKEYLSPCSYPWMRQSDKKINLDLFLLCNILPWIVKT